MDLNTLISEYALAETALRTSLELDAPARRRVNLLRLSADRLEAIENYEPASKAEARDKVLFFMMRAISRPGISVDGRDINLVLTLTGNPDIERRTAYSEAAPAVEHEGRFDGLGRDLIRFITGARERMSLFDERLHFLATSRPNAAFYGTRPARMIGLHLADVIGEPICNDLSVPRFDAARAGEPQEYYYDIEVRGQRHRCRCQIKPIIIDGGQRAFLTFTRDVTLEIDIRDESLIAARPT